MIDDADIARLRALTHRGDGQAAGRLHAEAVRRDLEADRRLAVRVLVETGRYRIEAAGHVQPLEAGSRKLHSGSWEAPLQPPVIEVYVGARCLAVVAGRTSWCSGRVPARVVIETLRASFESNHTFDVDAVFAHAGAPSASMVRSLAGALTRCPTRPAPIDNDVHGLRQALMLANDRLRACNQMLGYATMFGACVDAVVMAPPRLELIHVGLGTALHARGGTVTALTQRQDQATRIAVAGHAPTGQLGPGQSWAQLPAHQLGMLEHDALPAQLQVRELELGLGDELLVVTDAVARRLRHGDVWRMLRPLPARQACQRLVSLAVHDGSRWDGGAGVALVRLRATSHGETTP